MRNQRRSARTPPRYPGAESRIESYYSFFEADCVDAFEDVVHQLVVELLVPVLLESARLVGGEAGRAQPRDLGA